MRRLSDRAVKGPYRNVRGIFRKSLPTRIEMEIYLRKPGWIARISRAIDRVFGRSG